MSCCGLFVIKSDKPVPLTSVHYDVSVKGFAGSITVHQTYKNVETTDLECVYGFPMNDQAAVTRFTVKMDDRVLTSQLKKKDEAFKEYDEALKRGNGAYLLDQSDRSDDTFVLSVGRLPPGKECVVSITFVCTLDIVTETKQRLLIPMALFPRYNPKSQSTAGTTAPPENYAASVPYKATLYAKIETLDRVRSVSSVSHPIAVDIVGPKSVQVAFGAQEQPLNRDLVIDIEINSNPQHHVLVEHVEGDRYAAMYSFVPQFEKSESKVQSELIFVVDCSGSMAGNNIQDAKRAMQIFLRSIPEGCYFNFYKFGSTFESLFSESKLYGEDTFKAAKDYASATGADLGGTEILQPLIRIFSTPPVSGFARQLFVLTDGEVGNTEDVINLVRNNASNSRVFSFGIGDSCSRSLVNGIAMAGNGKSEYCKHGEILEDKIGRHLERALQPAVVRASVLWEGVKNVKQVPHILPPVFRGDRQIAYAFFEKDSKKSPKVILQLKDKLPKETAFTLPGDVSTETQSLTVKLAARALIKYLETSPAESPRTNAGGSLQSRKVEAEEPTEQEPKDADNKERITEISLKYGVMSKYVSLLAVEKRENAQPGEMHLREIPVELVTPPMPEIQAQCLMMRCSMPVPGMAVRHRKVLAKRDLDAMTTFENSHVDSTDFEMDGLCDYGEEVVEESCVERRKPKQGPVLNQVLDLQLWNGSWEFSADFERMLGVSKDAAQRKCDVEMDSSVLATLLATAFLMAKTHQREPDLASHCQESFGFCAEAHHRGTGKQSVDFASNFILIVLTTDIWIVFDSS